MKSIIKKTLKLLFKPVAKKFGFINQIEQVQVGDKNELLNNFFNCLHQINFQIKHIVDVGANHGTWTRKALEYFPNAYFTLIEPQGWLKNSINDLLTNNPKIHFHAVGAGEFDGTFKFTIVDRDDSCSFKYTDREALELGFKQIDIPVLTINNLLKNNSTLPIPDIIKIDAEGLDINVVKGASNYFGKTEIFMVEAAVMNKEFSNDVLTMLKFMDNIGYKLLDITDLNRTIKHNALWLVELVFIKKNGFVDSSINSYL